MASDAMNAVMPREEQRQFERLLQQLKVGNIADRLRLWQVFLSLPQQHLTVYELHQELRERGWNQGLELVMDTLELLISFGLVAQSYLDGITCYEQRHLGEHHDHLLCMRCGNITEFYSDKLEELQQSIVREQGFHPLSHKLVVRGLCRGCLGQREKAVPLSQFGRGERVVVETVGLTYAGQLSDLGIIAGAHLQIISHTKSGLVAALNGSRLALSREWCEQIMVHSSIT